MRLVPFFILKTQPDEQQMFAQVLLYRLTGVLAFFFFLRRSLYIPLPKNTILLSEEKIERSTTLITLNTVKAINYLDTLNFSVSKRKFWTDYVNPIYFS